MPCCTTGFSSNYRTAIVVNNFNQSPAGFSPSESLFKSVILVEAMDSSDICPSAEALFSSI